MQSVCKLGSVDMSIGPLIRAVVICGCWSVSMKRTIPLTTISVTDNGKVPSPNAMSNILSQLFSMSSLVTDIGRIGVAYGMQSEWLDPHSACLKYAT